MKNESKHNSSTASVPNPGFTLESLSFNHLTSKSNHSLNISSPKTFTQYNNCDSFISSQKPKSSVNRKQFSPPNNLFIEKQIYSNTKQNFNANPKLNKYTTTIKRHCKKQYSVNENAQTLLNVLDTQNTTAPSELKQFQNYNERKLIEEFNTLTTNMDTNNQINHLQTRSNNQEPTMIVSNPINQYIIESLASLLNLLDPILNELLLEEKIVQCLEMLKDKRKGIRLGSVTAIYLMLKKYEKEINTAIQQRILSTMIDILINYNSKQEEEELLLVCCIEVLSLYDYNDELSEHIPLFINYIQMMSMPLLQNASFDYLMRMEYDGMKALIDLASDKTNPISRHVLDKLLQTPHIQTKVIAPSLVKVLYSNDNHENKLSSLAALNRMYNLICDKDIIESLIMFYTDKNIPKEYIASILRLTNTKEAEAYLISQFETSKDFSIRNSIANVFGVRYPKTPHYLSMKLEKNDSFALSNQFGSFCSYSGNVNPAIDLCYYSIEELIDSDSKNGNVTIKPQSNNSNDYLNVNPRDFLCALNRMLKLEIDHANPRLTHNRKENILDTISLNDSKYEILYSYSSFFEVINSDCQEKNKEVQGSNFISLAIIKALCKGLTDFSSVVRETVATSIGNIGLPEGQNAIDALMNSIDDEDINVSSKVIWAIGRIAQGVSSDVIPHIVSILKTNNIWKKKKACLYALEKFGPRCSLSVISFLVKLFKESIINKDQISNVLLKIGNEGEKALIQLLTNDLPDKLTIIIIQTLANINLHSSNLDFVIENIYQQGNHSNHQVRKNVLQALFNIFIRSDDGITYMRDINLIPFFYDKLNDKDFSIQQLAIKCITALGPQGELVLIEGFTRDKKTQVRINCVIGLSKMGIHNIRTLIQGLCDNRYDAVKQCVEKILINTMPIDAIMGYFTLEDGFKETQLLSILALVKTILENKYVESLRSLNYLTELQNEIEKLTQNSLQLFNDDFSNRNHLSQVFTIDNDLK